MPSSVIRPFSYDPTAHTLDVHFVSGRRYAYLDVPTRVAAALNRAASKGGFFNRRIRDRYRFARHRRLSSRHGKHPNRDRRLDL